VVSESSYAQAGQVVVSQETAQRSGDRQVWFDPLGAVDLKASPSPCRSTRPTAGLRRCKRGYRCAILLPSARTIVLITFAPESPSLNGRLWYFDGGWTSVQRRLGAGQVSRMRGTNCGSAAFGFFLG
jgi:hypothetical protein